MNNKWNKIIYKVWTPFYDSLFNRGPFVNGRKIMFDGYPFNSNQKLLFVGVGTGADLAFVQGKNLDITGTDLSPSMINQARKKYPSYNYSIMDAQSLSFSNGTYDYVIANLILSVVPNPLKCLEEILRVTKESGEIWIFDKFSAPDNKYLTIQKCLSMITSLFGTDISVNFEKLMYESSHNLSVYEDVPVWLKGRYRLIKIKK
ncbi:class I SAM-dependent methyltransferase [Halobacillus litoralis]|uniref:class I SAM-dependent methyltransferase n=1 Tax=Halobacillus litoralis TaxID=45668 RepID=UPI0024920979|nr:class I SAM-dependent methyltransferase [Halobacillus litoralis]